jgi:hypothetical protein
MMRRTGLRAWAAIVLFGFLIMGFSIAQANQPVGDTATSGIPVENWVGKIFIVLPLEAEAKGQGYPFSRVKPAPAAPVAENQNINASLLEGKELRVQKVQLLAIVSQDPPMKDYQIIFESVADGSALSAPARGGQVEQVVLADDYAAAKQYFLGKTVFSKRPAISEYKETPGFILVGVDEPLKVVDVILGVNASSPIWLVVTTPDGKKGYIAIAFSNTNAYQGIARKEKPWMDRLFEQSPRDIYQWPEEVWAAINRAEVRPGMIPDQVRLSWGEPNRIESGPVPGEQVWYYPSTILKFKKDSLNLIEER